MLIALWVNAWYGGILDARDEQIDLGQLIEDLAETERQMQEAASRTQQAEESAIALIRAIRGDGEPRLRQALEPRLEVPAGTT